MSMNEGEENDEEFGTATILTSTGLRQATLATPKALPQTKFPPRSILKKRSMDTAAPTGLPHPSPQVSKIEPFPDTSSDKVHPDASGPAPDHRAPDSRLPPGSSSQSMASPWTAGALVPPVSFSSASPEAFEFGVWPPVPKAATTPSPLLSSLLAKFDLSPPDLSPPSTPLRAMSHGAAFPPDFTPGVQSNSYQDRGGERSQGENFDQSYDPFPPQQYFYGGGSVEHSQQQQQGNVFSYQSSQYSEEGPFASSDIAVMLDQEGDGHDYGQVESGQSISVGGYGPTNGMGSSGVLSENGMNRRSINFLDTIEIIPAHRKSDYNRRSDKNATFKILTADMKSEIREELNSYKMREMAVHIDSMGNTAFH
ncbi:hypothetical protein BG003_009281 [Podila horticola]|nr:hypothetical protein BG003_009281 [Podila horticola]